MKSAILTDGQLHMRRSFLGSMSCMDSVSHDILSRRFDLMELPSPLLSSPRDGLTHCEMYSALGSNNAADTSRAIRDRRPWTLDQGSHSAYSVLTLCAAALVDNIH